MFPGGVCRERTSCELAFGVLKALMVSYSLWGSSSGLEPSQLSAALQTGEIGLDGVLDYLAAEGLVYTEASSGRVRLTDRAARDLLC